jgi:hypothetical protein
VVRQLTALPTETPSLTDPTTSSPAPSPASLIARVWARPLWNHVAALAVILIALVPVIGTGASFSADEGAAIVQAQHLSRGKGWIVDHPLPQADPTGKAYPLELSGKGPKGTAPFVKHPLYALLLAGADRLGGVTAMVLLSVAGTLAAAVLASILGARIRPGLARPTLWATGLASPLLFDGYLVIAHTLGAAFAAGAVVFALRGIEGRGRSALAVAGTAACVAAATLLRNEALFWGVGLGLVLGVLALRRSPRCAALAVASVAAAGIAHLGEQAWSAWILGGRVTVSAGGSVSAGAGFLSDRLDSFSLTWLRPSYGGDPRLDLLLVLMAAALAVGSLAVRRNPDDHRAVITFGVVAAVAAVAALVSDPSNVVPGLLVACPLLIAGLVALRRTSLSSVPAQVCLGAFALFSGAVAATQYATGGSGEWGGRYFAVGLPMILPVLLLALAQAGECVGPASRRAGVVALVACSMAMTVMGVKSLHDAHRFTARLMASAARVGVTTGSERPVMVATRGLVPRMAWATFGRQRWLLSQSQDLGDLVGNVRAAGIDRIVVVSDDMGDDLGRIGPAAQVVSRQGRSDGTGWQIVLLQLRP